MLEFEKRLQGIGQQTIRCVGDLMLDDFVYGEVARISPEAPAPVLAVKRNEIAIGYRIDGSENGKPEVVMNPPKSRTVELGEHDQIIVIAPV